LDPPYSDTEKYYKNIGEGGFQKEDHIRISDTLLGIEGKFLLSYNDCEYIRELYDALGIMIESYTRINNVKQRYDNYAQLPEIRIDNYDLHEHKRDSSGQMNLFDINNELNKFKEYLL